MPSGFQTGAVCAALLLVAPVRLPATDGHVAFFESNIRPILISHCYKCHAEEAGRRESGLWLDRRAGWQQGGERGPALVPGDVDASLLIQAIRYADPDLHMPPDKPLSPGEIDKLEQWVKLGAPDPRDGIASSDEQPFDPSDPIAGRVHWAFQPLVTSLPPQVTMTDWPRSTIDAFVLSQLEASNLRPAEEADRRTLVRRVFFQLIGLPPTPRQVASYLDDPRPDAYEKVIDQLLGSPQFGERWGRHWLDLARYADSNGLDENFLFREAWRYRNGVIDAVSADMPFNRFLLEQIAGDLLPHQSIAERDRQRIAAGFLVVGPKVLLGNDADERRMDVADEQLDTIGRAILGQTLGCARCHDHKFDPIPTADYYALAGIMTSTQVMQTRHMLNQQRLMERLVGLGADGDERNKAYETFWRERPTVKERRDHASSALKLLEAENEDELAELAGKHPDAVAEIAQDKNLSLAKRVKAQNSLIGELNAILSNPPPIPPRAMIPADREEPADEAIRLAGQFDHLGETIPRGFLRVFGDAEVNIPDGQSGRIQLARWLTDVEEGAGRLAARVLANRVWHHLIGRGIVRTVDNFGRTGEPPTHPELLDHLAGELIDSGWSLKHLVKQIVLSRTFRMSSRHCETGHAVDPDNRLLWRAHRRRLDPESLRDAMLSVAGQLDPALSDSTVSYLGDQATSVGDNKNRRRTDFPCRSVYLPVIRNDLPELFEAFDFADPHATTGMRPQTMVAMQGLYLFNDDSVIAAAAATAGRVLASTASDDSAARVDALFELLLCRRPTIGERNDIVAWINELEHDLADEGSPESERQAWAMACHALFASSRFQILE